MKMEPTVSSETSEIRTQAPENYPQKKQIIYNWFTGQRYKQLHRWHVNKLYRNCTYNRLPEDDPSGSKHVEDVVRIKILVYQTYICVFLSLHRAFLGVI